MRRGTLLALLIAATAGCGGEPAGRSDTPTDNLPPRPVVEASPASGKAPLTVSLDGSGSHDPDGHIDHYQWRVPDGGGATGPSHRLTFTAPGRYTVDLTVTDDDGARASARTTLEVVANLPPEAIATVSPRVGRAPLRVGLDASGSSDPDGSIVQRRWTVNGQPLPGSPTEHTFQSPGTYTLELTVTDDSGAEASAGTTVEVLTDLQPEARAEVSPGSGKAPLTVQLDGSASSDPDGSVVAHLWEIEGAGTVTGARHRHTFAEPGHYLVALTVTDDAGNTTRTTTTVDVVANLPPEARAQVSPTTGKAPLTVALDGRGSSDPDGSITDYRWTLDDGGELSGAQQSHTYAQPGDYAVRLTVTDDSGDAAVALAAVQVLPNQPPEAVIDLNPTQGLLPLVVSLDASGSRDADGRIERYQWSIAGLGSLDGPHQQVTFSEAGGHTVALTVTDDSGASASATAQVEVRANQPPLAVAQGSPLAGNAPLTVTLDGSGSADSDGTVTGYRWQVDGVGELQGARQTVGFDEPGSYSARLTVTDDAGATAQASLTVEVTASRGAVALKTDHFNSATTRVLTDHQSDSGGGWAGGDSALFTVLAQGGGVHSSTAERRVALAAETVDTQFQVAEARGRTNAGEWGVVCGWRGGYADGSGYLLKVNAAGEVNLVALEAGAGRGLASYRVPDWDPAAEHSLKLVYEPAGSGWAMLAAYLDGELLATNNDGARSMFRYLHRRLAGAGAPGLYAEGSAPRILSAELFTTDGVEGGYYTWPNVTLPYRAPMDRNMPSTSGTAINARIMMDQVVGGRAQAMTVDLSAKTVGVEGYGGTGMGHPPAWAEINAHPQTLSVRWQQYLGTGLPAIRRLKQQIVQGNVQDRRGAVLMNLSVDGSGQNIGIGIPGAVDEAPRVILGQWQEFEALYDYGNEVARLYLHRAGGSEQISSYSLHGFSGTYIALPEGVGWYWDDDHIATTGPETYSATRAVYFSRGYQGASSNP